MGRVVSEYKQAKAPVLEPDTALDSSLIAADSGRAERLTRADRFSNKLSQTTAFVIVSIQCRVTASILLVNCRQNCYFQHYKMSTRDRC